MKIDINIILTIILWASTVLTWGQSICVVRGKITDAETTRPLPNASVRCSHDGKTYGCSSDVDGLFMLKLPRGINTTLHISHVGYVHTSRVANCNSKQVWIDVEMRFQDTNLPDIVIEKHVPLISQRGDTTVYHADAYKVHADATAYDLISQKLPGVGMRDGKLEAHGEQVKEIRIDGREYFKNDVNLALKNLPANVIDEIQIYDQISDYSTMTGFDDGNTHKAINIKTKSGTARSKFGKGYAGYGLHEMSFPRKS